MWTIIIKLVDRFSQENIKLAPLLLNVGGRVDFVVPIFAVHKISIDCFAIQ